MTADTGSSENRDQGSNQGQHRHKAASNYTRAGLTVFASFLTTAALKPNRGSVSNNNLNVGSGGGGSSAGSYSTPGKSNFQQMAVIISMAQRAEKTLPWYKNKSVTTTMSCHGEVFVWGTALACRWCRWALLVTLPVCHEVYLDILWLFILVILVEPAIILNCSHLERSSFQTKSQDTNRQACIHRADQAMLHQIVQGMDDIRLYSNASLDIKSLKSPTGPTTPHHTGCGATSPHQFILTSISGY